MDDCRDELVSGLSSLALPIEDSQLEQLLNFLLLIEKWNKAYNLTAIRNRQDMVALHLLDSLAIAPYISGRRAIDIGTGAGLPGIPLAIYMPEVSFTLLDSNSKKTRFVQQAVLELGLKNVSVCHSRVENYQPEQLYDVITTRAFAELSEIMKLTSHLLHKDGVLLAMKAQNPELELADARLNGSVITLKIPGIDAQRCLVKITNAH